MPTASLHRLATALGLDQYVKAHEGRGELIMQVRQRSSLLKAVITAFPCVSLPFLAVPLRSHRTVAQILMAEIPEPKGHRQYRP
eukprot:SAG22_NODE_74_length_22289_cov_65.265119_8_plen_84_part_00